MTQIFKALRGAFSNGPKVALLAVLLCSPAFATSFFVDCDVSSSGNGLSWATAWKGIGNITGLSAGDVVFFSGSATCSTYTVSQWVPIAGAVGNPVIYRVAQTTDTGHTNAVTISLTGSPGIFTSTAGSALIQGIWIDGNPGNNTSNMTLSGVIGGAGSTAFNGVHLSYLNMDGSSINGTTFQNVELNNISVAIACGADHFFTSGASAGQIGYTNNHYHDNIVKACQVNDSSGHGTDGFQWIENVTVDHNIFYSQFTATANGQHEDFIQTSGSFVDIHDNYFENAGNYPTYGDFFGSVSHWRFYNNICAEFTGHGTGISGQCLGAGFEPGNVGTMNDFTVGNNTCYAQDNQQTCIDMNNGAAGGNITNSFVADNLGYNTGFVIIPGTGGSVTQASNFSGTTGVSFVNAAPYPSADFRLQSGSTNAIGQGVNPAPTYLTNVYTTDKNGIVRGNPWDLGAVQISGNTPAPASWLLVNNISGELRIH